MVAPHSISIPPVSSYWCYLIHLAPVLALQEWVRRWESPSGVKFVLILLATAALLWVSYHWLVRRTVIGTLLNGPRTGVKTRDTPVAVAG